MTESSRSELFASSRVALDRAPPAVAASDQSLARSREHLDRIHARLTAMLAGPAPD